ncbi:MAG: lamin tail domain-containing protein, partial [Flavobacteriales bacterium]
MKRIVTSLLLLSFLALTTQAQVVVNEFSAANLNQFQDDLGLYEDWIELYNTSGSSVNIGGFFLSDNENKPEKWRIPSGTTIPGNGYIVFWCSGRDAVSGGEYHTNFKLKQTKDSEEIVLSDQDTVEINNIPLGRTQLGHSFCRDVNGGANWVIDITPTPDASNGNFGHRDGYAEKPVVDVTAGFYNGAVTVQMTNSPSNATVRYTTDGTLPLETSPVFSGSMNINSTQVLKLRSFSSDADVEPSFIEFNTYLINESFTLPVFSVAADEVTDLANGEQALRPHGSAEYFNADGDRTTMSYGELNSHGQDSWVNFQRSLDW